MERTPVLPHVEDSTRNLLLDLQMMARVSRTSLRFKRFGAQSICSGLVPRRGKACVRPHGLQQISKMLTGSLRSKADNYS